jgi:hypothetical protein
MNLAFLYCTFPSATCRTAQCKALTALQWTYITEIRLNNFWEEGADYSRLNGSFKPRWFSSVKDESRKVFLKAQGETE